MPQHHSVTVRGKGDSREAEVSVTIKRETLDAYLVDHGRGECWVPKSQITDICEDGDRVISIFVPEWLAVEKGMV